MTTRPRQRHSRSSRLAKVSSHALRMPLESHVFIDESKSRGYLVAAVAFPPDELVHARREVRALVMPGQHRLHFKSESDCLRKLVLDLVAELAPAITLYDSSTQPTSRQQREACLKAVLCDMAVVNGQMLVVETDDSLVVSDRKVLFRMVRELDCAETLVYRHLRAKEEMLLALPDAIAWCWQRQGSWREQVRPLIAEVRTV